MQTGARIRHRAPVCVFYRPGRMYFADGLLLCLSFGVVLAAVSDACLAGDWAWFWFFVTAGVVNVWLYLANVRWWLDWLG